MKKILQYAASAALLYFIVASTAWSIRNPTANSMTVLTHFRSVICFEKLGRYQGLINY